MTTLREEALAGGRRARRWGWLYAAEHRLRDMRAYYQTLIAISIGNPLVYLLTLGLGLGTLVKADLSDGAGGTVSYLLFVAPALLASAAVMSAAEEASYPILGGFKFNPVFYAMNASPISSGQVVTGVLLGVLARVLPSSIIYFVVIALFGAAPSPLAWLGIVTATVAGMGAAAIVGGFMATVIEDKGQPAVIFRFIIAPLFLFSGTFFPLDQLPSLLQWVGWISPLWHATQLGRVLSYGMGEPAWLTVVHVVYLLGLLVGGVLYSRYTFAKRLNK